MEGTGTWLAAAAVAIALAGIAIYAVVPGRRRSPAARLFRRFAEANGLTDAEERLLRRLADRVQPDNPAAVFVRRSLFESAAAEDPLPAAVEVDLRRKLYGP